MVLDMKTPCKRCNSEGKSEYKHVAGGMCFTCGRTPADQAQTPVEIAARRERVIGQIKGMLNRAGVEKAEGTLPEWIGDVRADLKAILGAADEDVRSRAVAAFAKLGVAA